MTQTTPAGWHPDPENPTRQRYWDGAGWTQNVAPAAAGTPTSEPGASSGQPAVDAPVLHTWKTSVGFSVLGWLLGPLLMPLLSVLLAIVPMMLAGFLTGSDALNGLLIAMAGSALVLIYAAKFYPSYFTEKPLLKSNRAISFANLLFGSWIGVIWNGNLTKKTKGISYVVLIVLDAIFLVFVALNILVALTSGAFSNSASTPPNPSSNVVRTATEIDVEPLERTEDASIHTDAETGASFVVPSTWVELPLSKERTYLDTKFRVSDAAYAMYGSVDLWSVLEEEERRGKTREDFDSMDDLDEDLREALYAGDDGAVRSIILNGVEYFVLDSPWSAEGVEMRAVALLRVEKGYSYQFQYWSTPDELTGGIEDEDLQPFYSMVASMDYSDSSSDPISRVDVGGVSVEVPSPPGFVRLTPEMGELYALQSEFVPPNNRDLGYFVSEKDAMAALSGERPIPERRFSIQVSRRFESSPVNESDFLYLTEDYDSELERQQSDVKDQLADQLAEAGAAASEYSDTELVLLQFGDTILYPAHIEDDRMYASSMLQKMEAEAAEGTFTDVVSATSTFLYVNERVLFLYVYGGENDLEWTREQSRDWANAILDANPE